MPDRRQAQRGMNDDLNSGQNGERNASPKFALEIEKLAADKVYEAIINREMSMREWVLGNKLSDISDLRQRAPASLPAEPQPDFSSDGPSHYPCPLCGKSYKTHGGRNRHMQTAHFGKTNKCRYEGCAFESTTYAERNAHEGGAHAMVRVWLKCGLGCGVQFKHERSKRKHERAICRNRMVEIDENQGHSIEETGRMDGLVEEVSGEGGGVNGGLSGGENERMEEDKNDDDVEDEDETETGDANTWLSNEAIERMVGLVDQILEK